METSNPMGMAGSLVSTVLQTVGYYTQSYYLDILTGPFMTSVGTLIIIIGAILCFTQFALTGNYKLVRWFLLGPTLFATIIQTRTETTGPVWKFGAEERNQDDALIQVEAYVSENNGFTPLASVSSIFAYYDNLVSFVVNESIRVINLGREKTDFKFLIQKELDSFIKSQHIEEPLFEDLLQHAFRRQCLQALEAGRQSIDYRNAAIEGEGSLTEWNAKYMAALQHRVTLAPKSLEYIAALKVEYPQLFEASLEAPDLEAQLEMLKEAEPSGLSPEEFRTQFEVAKGEVRQQYASLSCEQIWNFVLGGLLQKAVRTVDNAVDYGASRGMSRDDLVNNLIKSAGLNGLDGSDGGPAEAPDQGGLSAQKLNALYKAIAMHTLKNESGRGNDPSAFLNDMLRRTRNQATEVNGEDERIETERIHNLNEEWQEKTNLLMYATRLPYLQGLILYILAVTFPFFCLLLLIPGKHPGFLMWFMLWLWAKSWDIGFAVTMLISDALFSVMGTGLAPTYDPQISPDLAMTINAMREMDPTFQIGTYYNILAVCVMSIPTVSSYLVLGSLKGGAGLIASGNQTSGDMYSARAQNMQSETPVMGYRYGMLDDKMDRGGDYETYGRNGRYGLAPSITAPGQNVTPDPYPTLNVRSGDNALNYDQAGFYAKWGSFGAGVADGYGNEGAIGRLASAASTVAQYGSDKLMKGNELDRQVKAAWIDYDATYDQRNINRSKQARRWGMMEIPWSESADAGFKDEIDKQLNGLDVAMDGVKTVFKSISNFISPTGRTGEFVANYGGSIGTGLLGTGLLATGAAAMMPGGKVGGPSNPLGWSRGRGTRSEDDDGDINEFTPQASGRRRYGERDDEWDGAPLRRGQNTPGVNTASNSGDSFGDALAAIPAAIASLFSPSEAQAATSPDLGLNSQNDNGSRSNEDGGSKGNTASGAEGGAAEGAAEGAAGMVAKAADAASGEPANEQTGGSSETKTNQNTANDPQAQRRARATENAKKLNKSQREVEAGRVEERITYVRKQIESKLEAMEDISSDMPAAITAQGLLGQSGMLVTLDQLEAALASLEREIDDSDDG